MVWWLVGCVAAPPAVAPPPAPVGGAADFDGDGLPERWTREEDALTVFPRQARASSGFPETRPGTARGRREPDDGAGRSRRNNRRESGGDPGSGALEFINGSGFGNFVQPIYVPDGADRATAGAVARRWDGDEVRERAAIDGSFRWLWERDARAPLSPRDPFLWRRGFAPTWTEGEPSLPPGQKLIVSEADGRRVAAANAEGEAGGPVVILSYAAHNHHSLKEVDGCEAWRLFATDHGVVIRERDTARYAWVWISTHVYKLRWPTIDAATCHGDLVDVDVDTQTEGRQRIVVSPSLGRYGAVREPGDDPPTDAALAAGLAD